VRAIDARNEIETCTVDISPVGVIKVEKIPLGEEVILRIAIVHDDHAYFLPSNMLTEIESYVKNKNLSVEAICKAISMAWEYEPGFVVTIYNLLKYLPYRIKAEHEIKKIEMQFDEEKRSIITLFVDRVVHLLEEIDHNLCIEYKKLDSLEPEMVKKINTLIVKEMLFKH